MKLLWRPGPAPFESWQGYLHRLAHLNEMNGIRGLANLLGMLPYRLISSSPREVLETLGVTLPSGSAFVLDTPQQPAGHVYLARAGRSTRTRICPECLRENQDPLILAEWDAAFSFTCPRHQCALLDICPACGAALTYERSDLTVCICGYSLRLAKALKVAPDIELVLRSLSLPLQRDPRPAMAPSTEQEVLASWLIRRLHIADAGLFIVRRASRMKGEAFVSAAEVSAVTPWFSDWPTGFLSKLAEIQHSHQLTPSKILGLGPSGFQKHLPAVSDALIEFDRRKRTGKRPSSFSSSLLAQRPWMGIKQLMLQTGCCYHAIQTWMRFGWLGDVHIEQRPRGGVLYFIEMSAALRAIEMAKRTEAIGQIADEVGLDRTAIRCLIRAGVIQSIPFGAAKWNVRVLPAEVFELARSFLRIAVHGKPRPAEVVSISAAIIRLRKHDPRITADFVESVLSGRVKTRSFIHSPHSLEEISLRERDLSDWIRKRRR